MSKNTTAISRGALVAKMKIASSTKQKSATSAIIKVDTPNRAQRRAAKKTRVKP